MFNRKLKEEIERLKYNNMLLQQALKDQRVISDLLQGQNEYLIKEHNNLMLILSFNKITK